MARGKTGKHVRVLRFAILLAVGGAGTTGRAAAQAIDTTPPAVCARLWVRPAASLVLPGSGQLLARQDRGAIYLVTELFVLSQVLRLNQTARHEAGRFRDLAFDVARRGYAPGVRDP